MKNIRFESDEPVVVVGLSDYEKLQKDLETYKGNYSAIYRSSSGWVSEEELIAKESDAILKAKECFKKDLQSKESEIRDLETSNYHLTEKINKLPGWIKKLYKL